MLGDFRTKQPTKFHWFLWWRVDQDELEDQVAKYDTLGWFHAARKLSVLFLLLSIAITVALTAFGVTSASAYFDAVLFAILAAFIYRGHRWAMIAAMILWTFEKIFMVIFGLGTLGPSGTSLIVSILWWALYMHAFYLAFLVEQRRKKQLAPALNQIKTG